MKEETTGGAVACSLNPGELSRKRTEILEFFEGALERRELPDGFELSFPGDERTTRYLMELIRTERLCCRFLRFGLTFEPGMGPIRLTLGGSPQAKDFLERVAHGDGAPR